MNTCETCKYAIEEAGSERMHRLGFRKCAWMSEWHYVSIRSTCRFSPIRWSQRS